MVENCKERSSIGVFKGPLIGESKWWRVAKFRMENEVKRILGERKRTRCRECVNGRSNRGNMYGKDVTEKKSGGLDGMENLREILGRGITYQGNRRIEGRGEAEREKNKKKRDHERGTERRDERVGRGYRRDFRVRESRM